MVIASHAVFAARGFWPPNDPRGSWSDQVWAEHLKPFGDAMKLSVRHSVAHAPHDPGLRREIQLAMKFPPVRLDDDQRLAIAHGIAGVAEILDVVVYSCAILQNHVHLMLQRHREDVEQLVGFFKRGATRELTARGIHPIQAKRSRDGAAETPWVRGGWKRFLHTDIEIADASLYVWCNPERDGLAPQSWWFETPMIART